MRKLTQILGGALLVTHSIAFLPAALTDDLQVYLDFEFDLSNHPETNLGDQADGSGNAQPASAGGVVGNAALFQRQNAQQIYVPASFGPGDTRLGTSFTISAWYKHDPTALPLPADRFFVIEDVSNYYVSYGVRNTDDGEIFVNGAGSYYRPNDAPIGVWKHLVIVYSSDETTTTIDSWIDDAKAPQTLTRDTAGLANTGFNIGHSRDNVPVPRHWDGQIDEVAMWNRALSTAEITELYQRGSSGQPVTFSPPSWWQDVGLLDVAPESERNFAMANVGQLKNIASHAYAELAQVLDSELPFQLSPDHFPPPPPSLGETGYDLATTTAYNTAQLAPVNLGQVKFVAKPFYDLLYGISDRWLQTNMRNLGASHPNSVYPWDPGAPVTSNYSPANIGQLKLVFGLDFDHDSEDFDGFADLFEYYALSQFPSTLGLTIEDVNPYGDLDKDGLSDAFEAEAGTLLTPNSRTPYKPMPNTGLTVFTPEVRPFDPAP